MDGHALDGKREAAHELGSARGADAVVVPVGLVPDANLKGQLVQVADAADADGDVGLEVAVVLGRSDEFLHLLAQQLDVLERGIERHVDIDDFAHGLAPGNVLDPEVVQGDVGHLDDLVLVDAGEDGVQEGDPLDNELLLLGAHDVDAVADVVGVLDEQEDARAEEFLRRDGKDEGQREERSTSRGERGDEGALEHSDWWARG